MDRWLTLKEAVQVSGRSMSTVRRWLKRVRKSDPSAWENNVRLVSQVNTGLTKGLTTGLTKGLNGQAEYQEYTIREPFLLDRLGVGNRVVNDQGVDQGVEQGVEQGGISPGKDQAGPDGSAAGDQAGEIAFLRATVSRLLEDQARERERTDLILMNLRQDIATLTARIAIAAPPAGAGAGSTWTEAEATAGAQPEPAGPDPGQPVHQDQPEAAGPGLTFSDYAWLFGQGIKRLLTKRIF